MEPISDYTAPRLPGRFQVEAVHRVLFALLHSSAHRSDPDLSPPQCERACFVEGECSRVDSYRRFFLPDLCKLASRICFPCHVTGRPTIGFARSKKQCVAFVSVPSVYAHRVCPGKDVRSPDFTFRHYLDSAVIVISFSILPRRSELVYC